MGPGQQVTPAETLSRYIGGFLDQLTAAGVQNLCLCPGSRSTPVAMLAAQHTGLKLWVHLDERSCAYFALGMAKAGGRPVAILCSSGTASLNFAPAVAEAFLSNVPLIVLTADRPQELRELGANQTIDQVRLYGQHVKWFVEAPLPEANDTAVAYISSVALRAVSTALSEPSGPVHINFPFREPLLPAPYAVSGRAMSSQSVGTATAPAPGDLQALKADLSRSHRGLIVCGQQEDHDFALAVAELARVTGMPLLADVLSQVRLGPRVNDNILGGYDAFLRDASAVDRLAPDFILRFGATPTSKPLATYLQRYREVRQVLVSPRGLWRDPDLTADSIVYGDAAVLCQQLLAAPANLAGAQDKGWLTTWQEMERETWRVIEAQLAGEDAISEPGVVAELAAVLPEGATVFAGNSMPVRDLDSFLKPATSPLGVMANRGVSGIDGVTSSALGAAAVGNGRLILLIGDLSFYHDMNGLLAARRFDLNATIVLVNNDGGGIFSFLPQAQQPEHFEQLFGTPHGLDFRPVAELYGLNFRFATTPAHFRQLLQESFRREGVSLIEVRTDRETNLALHQRIWSEVSRAVKPQGVV